MRQAARVAINRTVAGLHFPVDSAAGQLLGLTLGDYFVHRCGAAPSYRAWRFDGERYVGGNDFDWRWQFHVPTETRLVAPFTDKLAAYAVVPASVHLKWMWNRASTEWN
jgi:hypothetical protein